MKTTNPAFWNELVQEKTKELPSETEKTAEDEVVDTELEDEEADDCNVPIKTLVHLIVTDKLVMGVAL